MCVWVRVGEEGVRGEGGWEGVYCACALCVCVCVCVCVCFPTIPTCPLDLALTPTLDMGTLPAPYGQMEELQIELTALRHLVRLKNKELRTIRRLSETILQQRSEVRGAGGGVERGHMSSAGGCVRDGLDYA